MRHLAKYYEKILRYNAPSRGVFLSFRGRKAIFHAANFEEFAFFPPKKILAQNAYWKAGELKEILKSHNPQCLVLLSADKPAKIYFRLIKK